MRKTITIVSLLLIKILLFSHDSAAETEAGKVLTVRKDVYLVRETAKNVAKPQMALRLKDGVETGSK